jgi:ParB-like chromosome segregation protein Spo0J
LSAADFHVESLPIDDIFIVTARRGVSEKAVVNLTESIRDIGLRTPITVRVDQEITDPETGEVIGGYALVTGAHRLEACRRLGMSRIPGIVRECDEIDARKWEISENLHRSELTALERDEQVARWIELTSAKQEPVIVLRQVDAKPGRPEGGVRAAARELGISEPDARRAVKVASLSPEAKQAAVEAELEDNRSVLLAAAKEKEPAKQVEVMQARSPILTTGPDLDARMKARDEREKADLAKFLATVETIKPLLDELKNEEEEYAWEGLTYLQVAERYKPILALRAYRWRVGYGKAAGDASRRIEAARDDILRILTGTAEDEIEATSAMTAATTDTFDGAPIPRTPEVDLEAA